jgi:pyruvate,water dikinase
MNENQYMLTFKEATKEDYAKLGGKGASLASMSAANFPVPSGFCITTDAYKTHLDDSGLWEQILEKAAWINFNDMFHSRYSFHALRLSKSSDLVLRKGIR